MKIPAWIWIFLAGALIAAAIFAPMYAMPRLDRREDEEAPYEKTTLPMSTRRWLEAGIETGKHNRTWVLELEHGWLVYRETYMGSAMVFVPRQEKPEDQGKPDRE